MRGQVSCIQKSYPWTVAARNTTETATRGEAMLLPKSVYLCRIRLSFELLEGRCLLSGNIPWPLTPPNNAPIDLKAVYGQFVDTGGPIVLHEGIDIVPVW